MSGFSLLWGKILSSSLWVQESKETRLVWITMLAMRDKEGIVQASIVGLADRAKVSLEECKAALVILLSPDQNDTSKVEEGRRIREVQGGWQIINHDLYRFSTEAKREFWAEQKRIQRKNAKPQIVAPVPRFTKPTSEELSAYATAISLPAGELMKFHDHYESNGWKVGRNSMKDWQAAMRKWKSNAGGYSNGLLPLAPGASPLLPIDKSILQGEYDRVLKRLETLRGTYSGTQTWSTPDKEELSRLKARRDELRSKLGITI